jgi:putative drug exporter of the RND superfamily
LSNIRGLERYGRIVAGPRTKWVTILLWIVVAGLLTVLLPSAKSQENNNAPNLSDKYASVQGDMMSAQEFPNEAGVPALLVWHKQGGMQDADLLAVQSVAGLLEKEPLPQQLMVPPLHKLPPQALRGQLSADGSTLVFPVFFNKAAETEELKEAVESLQERVAASIGHDPFEEPAQGGSLLSARVTGPVGIQLDAVGLFKNADVSLLIGTVLLVLIFLLLIYRSPILALIPLVAVGFAYVTVNPLIGWMAEEGWITVDSQAMSIMTVLLFGAGTDYCLFLIARFRQLLKEEQDKTKALLSAISGSSGAIAMSGFTVVLSLLALLLAEYGAYHRFAVPFSLSIFIMGIGSLTLVPALLAVFGRTSFYPFIPRTPQMLAERAKRKGKPLPAPKPPHRVSAVFGGWIIKKPWVITLVTLALLGGLASFAPRITYTFDTLSSFPEDMASREGFTLIAEQFTPGELAPVKVMLDTEGKAQEAAAALKQLPFVSKVSEPVQGKNNPAIVAYEVELAMNPYSNEAMDVIPEVRASMEKVLTSAGITDAQDKVWLSGQTASQYDTRETGNRDAKIIIPVVIVLIALLLLIYLRSIVAMLYLMGTVLLSYFSALGLGWLIIHYAMGADAIQGFIPVYAFVFLVALGEDYNIFMISGIWQKSRTMPLHRAIKEGVMESGSVITSAGLILAGTFAVLGTLPIQILVHFGIITAIGVLLDTFVVRPFLVPALTVLLGRRAFWPGRYVPVPEEGKPAAQ